MTTQQHRPVTGPAPAAAAARPHRRDPGVRRGPGLRRAATVLALLGTLLGGLLTLGAGPAQAGDYRYWAFWEQEDHSWSYAQQGPATLRPEDGAVLGFRFTVGADAGDAGKPRGGAEFADICADEPKQADSARVALVLDFGTARDADSDAGPPRARRECARVDEGGTAADALAASTEALRYDSAGMLCAIEGYPKSGCGEQVSEEKQDGERSGASGSSDDEGSDTADSAQDDDGLSAGLGVALGVGVVLVLGAGALWQVRRRRV